MKSQSYLAASSVLPPFVGVVEDSIRCLGEVEVEIQARLRRIQFFNPSLALKSRLPSEPRVLSLFNTQ